MSLIIATGSNLGDKASNLAKAKEVLSDRFQFVAESSIYSSKAYGHREQPDFLNQVLEFSIPQRRPEEVMRELLGLEKQMGRDRQREKQKWGPRLIDLDIIFWGSETINTESLITPHPRWKERAFVALPLTELPFFQVLEKSFKIPTDFDNQAIIVASPQGRQKIIKEV
jgi:2-amino-4-hydroxy-6-hydroxymethyldihydropteridine diphosphokinase